MDLIATVLAFFSTMFASLIGAILAHDACNSVDHICAVIVKRAALRLAPIDQEEKKAEWLGDLSERETLFEKYRHAIGCYLAAGSMRRQALTLTIAINVRIANVGAFPIAVKVKPSSVAFSLATSRNVYVGKVMSKLVPLWVALRICAMIFGSVLYVGRNRLPALLDKIKNVKDWQYEVRIRRKGLELDLTKLMYLMKHDREKGKMMFERLNDILSKRDGGAPGDNEAKEN